MKVSNLRVENRGEDVALVADVKSETFGENTIWGAVPKEFESYLCANHYDAFLVALLYPAMAFNESIEIEGTVSKRLLRNINAYIQDILLAYNYNLHRISITSKETTSEILSTATHIGTGFSGGIDSFSTIYDNYVLENDAEYKIDTLVILNVGSHGKFFDPKTKRLFESRYNFLKPYPGVVGLPFISVDSNIHFYYKEWDRHMLTLGLNLTAGILLMQGMFKRYYVASTGYNYDVWIDIATKKRNLSLDGFCDPFLIHLLSTETTEFILDGMQDTRVQKTINISNYPLTKQFLDVCWFDEPQKKGCGVCQKCARVGLTFSAIGKLDDYKDVLNLEVFKKNEYRLMCEAVLSYKKDVFMRDIVDLAKANGKKYPPYFVAFVRKRIMGLKRRLRKK
jgi:hypothetical protein